MAHNTYTNVSYIYIFILLRLQTATARLSVPVSTPLTYASSNFKRHYEMAKVCGHFLSTRTCVLGQVCVHNMRLRDKKHMSVWHYKMAKVRHHFLSIHVCLDIDVRPCGHFFSTVTCILRVRQTCNHMIISFLQLRTVWFGTYSGV
jgi:hypothetical protein